MTTWLSGLLTGGGLFTTQDAEAAGLSRQQLTKMVAKGELERVSPGIYTLADTIYDRYEALQLKTKRVIYSHETALYFHGMSDRSPHLLHLTVPQGFNASRLKGRGESLKVHYVPKAVFELGLMEITSPLGGNIRLYDPERTICDIIRDRQAMDAALFSEALNVYFSSNQKQPRKLIRMSRTLGIEAEVRRYMEVL